MQPLRITLVQTTLVWEDKTANLQHFNELISTLKNKTDIILLPEMFTTGFSMNPSAFAEKMNGETLQWLRNKSSELNAVVTGSAMIEEEGNYYNRLLWVQPEGRVLHADKRHLFSMAGEEKVFTAGKEKLITEYKGWRICPMVCYDLRFPVWARNSENYDVLIFVANWPERRIAHWKKLLPARAIENLSFVAGLNRIGVDGTGLNHTGDSAVYNPMGEEILVAGSSNGCFTIELNYEELTKTRRYMPFLADGDKFRIE